MIRLIKNNNYDEYLEYMQSLYNLYPKPCPEASKIESPFTYVLHLSFNSLYIFHHL